MKLIERSIKELILDALKDFPVVYINGPRQAGKTTLAKELLHREFPAPFVTFDDLLERGAAKRNPRSYLKAAPSGLIIDEVQLVPEIFRPLKQIIDEERLAALKEGKHLSGRYLLTGSANLIATPALADAMVGRMATMTLLPLSVAEKLGKKSNFLERCFQRDFSELRRDDALPLPVAMSYGSFPDFVRMEEGKRETWIRSYASKVMLEDPRQMYHLEKAQFMPLLLESLAARAGSLVNDASISREIGLSTSTTRNYRALLDQTFVTYALKPWHRNISKRLVKSGKIYFYDVMLLCHLLGQSPQFLAKNSPHRFGHVLENFVLSELLKAKYSSLKEVKIRFYRSSEGKEVDFVLEWEGKLIAIEVKHAEMVTEKDLAGIKELEQLVGEELHCALILCNTPRALPFGPKTYLVPFSALWSE